MRALVLLAGVLLLAGCALLRPEAGETGTLYDIVGDAVSAARASPEEQKRLLAQAQQRYVSAPDDVNRVRLAAYFATLPPPWRDEARAALLLEPLAARAPRTPVEELAVMLATSLSERQRLVGELRAVEQRAQAAVQRADAATQRADAATQRADAATQRADAAEQRAQAAADRASTLQQQVETLKSIERGILEREERRRNQQR